MVREFNPTSKRGMAMFKCAALLSAIVFAIQLDSHTRGMITDLSLLQGEWKVHSVQYDSKPPRTEFDVVQTLAINGDWLSGNDFYRRTGGRISIDPRSKKFHLTPTSFFGNGVYHTSVWRYEVTANQLTFFDDEVTILFVRQRK